MLIKCATVLSFYLFIAYLHGYNTSTKTMGSRSQFMGQAKCAKGIVLKKESDW